MWENFEGVARTREETAARIGSLKWTDWSPKGVTLHNTAAPTLKQWAEKGPAHDDRIRNLEDYYERELGWHAGPHFFVSRNWINWFSNPLLPGVHSRCFNATRFGIEMVGDYNVEEFDSGDGALVRDNAVFLVACLNKRFGFDPGDLTFHVECRRDNHDCPGHKVVKSRFIDRVRMYMGEDEHVSAPAVDAIPTHPTERKVLYHVKGRMSTFGGPDDDGMGSNEGIALYPDPGGRELMRQHGLADYILPGNGGLGHHLNPDKFYCASRWPVNKYPFLRDAIVHVSSDGQEQQARAVDWGPNTRTNRVADLSPGLADALGLDTNGICELTVYEDGK